MKTLLVVAAVLMGLALGCFGEARPGEGAGTTGESGHTQEGGRIMKTQVNAQANTRVKKLVEHRSGEWTPELTEAEKQTLFAIARDTLKWRVGGRKEKWSFENYLLTPKLKADSATFVTFKTGEELRGCMGCLKAVEPMYLSVHSSADNAAKDPRFVDYPITADEIPRIEIHVSILSAMKAIGSLDEFKLGEHGILLQKGFGQAVFLPEVAVEQKWSKDETLSYLARKAGLPGDAWKQGAKFMVFSSVVIAEE